jgi:hypothetical protein
VERAGGAVWGVMAGGLGVDPPAVRARCADPGGDVTGWASRRSRSLGCLVWGTVMVGQSEFRVPARSSGSRGARPEPPDSILLKPSQGIAGSPVLAGTGMAALKCVTSTTRRSFLQIVDGR